MQNVVLTVVDHYLHILFYDYAVTVSNIVHEDVIVNYENVLLVIETYADRLLVLQDVLLGVYKLKVA